jgi:hypothetical protein
MRRLFVFILAVVLCSAIAAPAQAALRAPTLTGPANEAGVEALPTFYWNKVANAERYDFQLSASSKFTSVVNGTGTGRGSYRTRNTAATLDKTIPDGAYYWRVRAVSARDTAGKWSPVRSFTKGWTTAPVLQEPADDLSVSWPALPLVLRWSVVPHAVKYHVTVATDPALASPVVGSVTRPLETSGTNYALPGSLAQGRYYWAITPIDAQGHKGTRSRVGSFVWAWPTATGTRVDDINDTAAVFDPLMSWNPVPGAAKYEVEVNYSQDFAASSKVCCTDAVIGTSLAPTVPMQNNTYYWRMRAVDADGNAGVWNHGPNFKKAFDDLTPSILNLRMRDAGPSTSVPVVQWDPVPGASSYRVQVLTHSTSGCNFASPVVTDETASTAWAPLSGFTNGSSYCVRVQARSDRPTAIDNGYVSDWTQLNGAGQAAFTYVNPTLPPGPIRPAEASDYLGPLTGAQVPRTPVFTWKPIPGATGYRVRVARDAAFTTIVDDAITSLPVYTPGSGTGIANYTDETTSYYWAIVPRQGNVENSTPADNSPQSFDKRSAPPVPLSPVNGTTITSQPTFRWAPAEGARKYHLQVSQDPTFANPIDDVTTTSTAYTSSSTYPADTLIYWRVRASVEATKPQTDPKLTYSETQTFQRRLPAPDPAGGNPAGGSDIPVLSWTPVEGAVSYGLHVDQSDGTAKDFTLESTSFTPTQFYGTGIWRWRVRANFPAKTGSVSSGYFAPQQYVRTIPAPTGARAVKTGSRLLIFWDPNRIAKRYKAEISSTSGFGNRVVATDTDNTAWAPDLISQGFKDGGTLYWRVANVDDGNNVGAWTTGSFVLPKRIAVIVNGRLRRGVRRPFVIKLQDAKGRAISKASVSATGAGMRRVHKRTGKKGTVRMFLRPRRRGTVVIRATRRGYAPATARLKAY